MVNKILVSDFTSSQAAAVSGLTPYMLDYLCRSGTLRPSIEDKPGRGCPRKYSFGDLVVLRVVKMMLDAGVSVARTRTALDKLADLQGSITRTELPGRFMITNGEDVFIEDEMGQFIDLGRGGQMVFCFMIELAKVRDDAMRQVDQMETSRNAS